MSYYKLDRKERKSRAKAFVITTIIYLGAVAFFVVKDDVNWQKYIPFLEDEAAQEVSAEPQPQGDVAAVRP